MHRRLRARAVVAAIVIAVAVTGCASGRDAVAQGGTFEFVSPGGKTDIFYDPPEARGTIGDVSGPALMTDQPIHLSDFGGRVVVINIWGWRFQAIDATAGGLDGSKSSSSRASAGVLTPSVLRGRVLSSAAT
jgi:hypothetical protein